MLQFTVNRGDDADETALRKLLKAHLAYQRMSAAKLVFLHLVAVVGVVLWISAAWPSLVPAGVRLLALVVWGVVLVFAVCAGIEERLWHRKVARYRREHPTKQQDNIG